ncbi:MAG: methionine biosynthesis protein MetW [Acidimicrobiales bacterium]
MSDTDEVLAYLHAAKARVDGGGTAPTRGPDAVRYARARLEEALPHAHAGAHLPEDARLKPVKQAVLGAVRPVTSHQEPFNRAVLQAIDGVAEALDGVLHRADLHEQQAARLQAGVATAELAIDDLADDVRSLRHEVGDLAASVAALHASVEAARSEAAVVRAQQEVVLRTARQALADQGISVGQLTELSRELGTGHERLYQDLEDRFRGTAEEVRAKVAPYLADIEATAADGPVVDVGCGRGEWLGLLAEAGVEAYGIDTNEVVVERCRALGLDVRGRRPRPPPRARARNGPCRHELPRGRAPLARHAGGPARRRAGGAGARRGPPPRDPEPHEPERGCGVVLPRPDAPQAAAPAVPRVPGGPARLRHCRGPLPQPRGRRRAGGRRPRAARRARPGPPGGRPDQLGARRPDGRRDRGPQGRIGLSEPWPPCASPS